MNHFRPGSLFFTATAHAGLRRAARVGAAAAVAVAILASPEILAASAPASQGKDVQMHLLSSPPQFVSGGDARIEVRAAPGLHDKLEFYAQRQSRRTSLLQKTRQPQPRRRGQRPAPGRQHARGYVKGQSLRDTITLTNYPITGPMFTGPQQTPFVCTTIQGAVGSPAAGRQRRAAGLPGHGRRQRQHDRLQPQLLDRHFRQLLVPRASGGSLEPLPADGSRPADMGTVTLADGRTVDFVVRREVGSINRFLYSIAMLAPLPGEDNAAQNDTSLWNRKLLYWFQGGVAIGHTPGIGARRIDEPRHPRAGLRDRALERQQHRHALQPEPRRRDGDDDQGALHRALRRADLHRGPRRLGRRDPAVHHRPEPPGRARRAAAGAELSRHGHADHPRRRLRAARVLHGRHRPHQSEVAHDQEPHAGWSASMPSRTTWATTPRSTIRWRR